MPNQFELVKTRFETDKFAQSLGIVLDTLTSQTIQMHMILREDMNNWFNRIHGGAIYSLADAAFSLLANKNSHVAVALECSITYHASPEPNTTLVVYGETLSASKRTAAYLFKVFMEKNATRTLIATMKSVSYKTKIPINKENEEAL
ncbi:MAG: hotdog fold thioesterase [Deltaproteobacteria bacterium]|nr:hotdog fold thioesterase [Deltaproteobacteria bacterium]